MTPETGPTRVSSFRAAVDAFAKAGDEDAHRKVRAAALLAGMQGDVQADDYALVESLTGRIGESDPAVRATAARLLGVLLRAGTEAPATDTAARSAAERAIRALQPRLEDPDEGVRLQVVEALSDTDDPRWIDALLVRLRDPAALVRLQALSGLQRLDRQKNARIRDAARALADDPDPQVRELAAGMSGAPAR